MKRRTFVKSGLAAGAALAAPATAMAATSAPPRLDLKGNIRHSVCKWCYRDLTVDELAKAAAGMGIASVELLNPEEWAALEPYGITCAMAFGPMSIPDGWNKPANHERLIADYKVRLQEVADAGLPNVICFSGNRYEGVTDEEGLQHCAEGLKQIMSDAERLGVTVQMELLNSKVDHQGYMCDHTAWGAALVDAIGSDRFKLLYDIYHMQIMEGDVIRTIREYKDYIGHYHTGGNPGRNEIDETQELNYPAIMRAIVETGYDGFVAQEFIPTRAPLMSLGQSIAICDV